MIRSFHSNLYFKNFLHGDTQVWKPENRVGSDNYLFIVLVGSSVARGVATIRGLFFGICEDGLPAVRLAVEDEAEQDVFLSAELSFCAFV